MSITKNLSPLFILADLNIVPEVDLRGLHDELIYDLYLSTITEKLTYSEISGGHMRAHMMRALFSAYMSVTDQGGAGKFLELIIQTCPTFRINLDVEPAFQNHDRFFWVYDFMTQNFSGMIKEADRISWNAVEFALDRVISNKVMNILVPRLLFPYFDGDMDILGQEVWSFICQYADDDSMRQIILPDTIESFWSRGILHRK